MMYGNRVSRLMNVDTGSGEHDFTGDDMMSCERRLAGTDRTSAESPWLCCCLAVGPNDLERRLLFGDF